MAKKTETITITIKRSDARHLATLLNYGESAVQEHYWLVKDIKDQMITALAAEENSTLVQLLDKEPTVSAAGNETRVDVNDVINARLGGGRYAQVDEPHVNKRKKWHMSPEGRARVVAATKKRWAKYRKAKKAAK